MTQETYIKKLNTLVTIHTDKNELLTQLVYLINELKSDIAEAIKEKGQSSGGVDFISVPEAIQIVTDGGIPTKRELIELAQEYMNDGDVEKANELLDKVLAL